MFKFIFRLLFRLQGWKVRDLPPSDIRNCVMVGAPHTSNWDFVFTMAACDYMNLPQPRFTIKKEWMRFPFNLILGPMGAIPIDRSGKKAGDKRPKMVDEIVKFVEASDGITVLVTPEGTRGPAKRWRTGFYHVAMQSKVPILLGYLDYEKREVGVGKVIYPSGDIEKDLRQIWDFYSTIPPRYPERYIQL